MGALQAVTILLRQLFQSRGALVAENLAVLAYSSRSTENRSFRPGHIKKEGVFQMGFLLLGGPGETRETVLQSLSFFG